MMRIRVRAGVVLGALCLASSVAAQQPGPSSMPLLATAATPSGGMAQSPSQMAGVPLQVGDLPPGVVSVRLVRETFEHKIAGHEVELHVGSAGEIRRTRTDSDGRAQFAAVPVGTEVHAYALVDGEKLESQRFPLPAQGGVRLMLVAGGLTGGVPASSGAETATRQPSSWRFRLIAAAVLMFSAGVIVVRTGRSRPGPAPVERGPVDRRDNLFTQLISLEERYARGDLDSAKYHVEREQLFDALERVGEPAA